MPTDSNNEDVRYAVGCAVVTLSSFFLTLAYVVSQSRPELIATLELSDEATAYVYAEGELLYEGPGYLSLEVQTQSKTLVPLYEFTDSSGDPVPEHPFSVTRSRNGTVAAVTQFKDAVFIIDFGTGEYWPPSGWDFSKFNPELGARLLDKLNEDTPGRYTCYFLGELEQRAARRNERLNESTRVLTPEADAAK